MTSTELVSSSGGFRRTSQPGGVVPLVVQAIVTARGRRPRPRPGRGAGGALAVPAADGWPGGRCPAAGPFAATVPGGLLPLRKQLGRRTAPAAGYAKRACRHTVGMWGTVWFTCRWQWRRCWWRHVPVTVSLRRALSRRRRGRALLRRARLNQVWSPRTGVLGSRRSARCRCGRGRGSTRRIWPCRM